MLLVPLLLQASELPMTEEFDLASVPRPRPGCASASGKDEIVVCGERSDLPTSLDSSEFEPAPVPGPGLGFRLSDTVRLNVFGEAGSTGGFPSKRATVSVTIAF